MDDIEKEIEEGIEENIEEEKDEFFKEEKMRGKLNYPRRDDNKKKIILYVVLGLFALAIVGLIIYIVLNKDNKQKNTEEQEVNEVVEKEEDISNIGYVSCDDNTSLLNVRNSTTGDIIDGLSCYQEVTIEEELEKTDNCDKWYKISYKKHDNNYTGYVCATYIKKETIKSSTKKEIKELIDKANKYYETIQIKPYCGEYSETKTIKISDDGGNFDGQYVKSEFKNIDELKKYLTTFLSNNLINNELTLSDYNNPKMYDNYYEIDGNLYCRNYTGKGFLTRYTGNYNIEIIEETNDKIIAKIAYEYITEAAQAQENTKCSQEKSENCTNSQLEYKIKNIEITKKDNNYVITKFEFHE